jgi:hypothetical protein
MGNSTKYRVPSTEYEGAASAHLGCVQGTQQASDFLSECHQPVGFFGQDPAGVHGKIELRPELGA